MRSITCSACGSNVLTEVNGYYVCQYCGTRFVNDRPSVVARPSVASINNADRIENMLRRADIFWRNAKRQQAIRIYRQVLELDATCAIALQSVRGR